MSKATHAHTTPTPTRRALFGSCGAMLLLAAPGAGATKADELDGELLAACKRFHAAEARVQGVPRAFGEEDDLDAALDDWYAALSDVMANPPRSPKGVQAAAGVAYVGLLDEATPFKSESLEEQASREKQLALQVLRNVAGRAAA